MSLSGKYNHYRIKILNKIYGHVAASVFIYVHLKYFFPNTGSNFMLKLLTVLLSPILFLTIWTLKLVKGVVELCLRCKEGDDFVQMVDGTDAYFIPSGSPKRRTIIAILFMLEFDGDRDAFGQLVKDATVSVFSGERFLKLQCSVVRGLGYYYYKQSHWPINNHFKPLFGDSSDAAKSMESLRKVISEVTGAPMPCNDTGLWEVRIGERHIEEYGKGVYPVVFRFDHIVGDGITYFHIFCGQFQNSFPSTSDTVESTEALRPLDARFTKSPFISNFGMADTQQSNVLCHTNGNMHIGWHIEETPEMLNTIKEMKAHLNNEVTVVDIVLTCFLESLDDYFSKTCTDLEQDKSYPNIILTSVPVMPPNYNFSASEANNLKLSNKFSSAVLRLPLKLEANPRRLLTRLELIRQEYDVIKNKSLDIMFNRWAMKVLLSLLPCYVLNWIQNSCPVLFAFTNIPGRATTRTLGGLKVKEFIFSGSNGSPGVGFAITSLDKRIRFAYSVDTEIIPNVDDVKEISASFIQNFNKLRAIVIPKHL